MFTQTLVSTDSPDYFNECRPFVLVLLGSLRVCAGVLVFLCVFIYVGVYMLAYVYLYVFI